MYPVFGKVADLMHLHALGPGSQCLDNLIIQPASKNKTRPFDPQNHCESTLNNRRQGSLIIASSTGNTTSVFQGREN